MEQETRTSAARDQDFWVRKLAPDGRAGLPLDFERASQIGERDRAAFTLSPGAVASIARLARGNGLLEYTVLVAAVKVCLSRLAGSASVVVGTPPRLREATDKANALPIHDVIDDRASVKELLKNVRSSLLDAYARQDEPFDQIARRLGVERLFDVAVVLTGLHGPLLAVAHDVTLTFAADVSHGEIAFDRSVLRRSTAEHFTAWIDHVIQQLADHVDATIGELDLVSPAERVRLETWSARDRVDVGELAHERFARWATRTPDAPAVRFAAHQLTYGELDRRANQLARHLRARGIGPERLVAVSMDRSIDLVVALLGVLKTGGAYLPIDPAYPQDRVDYIATHARPDLVLTHERFASRWGQVARVCLDRDLPEIARHESHAPEIRVDANQLAYVIYTSGSTGRPKGTLLRHGGLANLIGAQGRDFALSPTDRVLQVASIGFDASVSEVFVTLGAGATLELASKDELLPGDALAKTLRDREITVVTLTPTALAMTDSSGLPALRLVISAGEACSSEIIASWSSSRSLINAYGPTEATVCATLVTCARDRSRPSIGKPIANVEVYVLDDALRLAPIGVAGELFIGGVGLARGYLNAPGQAAARFVPHPFRPSERLYRSGDIVRWTPTGELDFIGRADNQVKIRGVRVELEEVEAAVRACPLVRDAAVAVAEQAGHRILVAYVVLADPRTALEDVLAFVATKLPDVMVPSQIVPLAALPLSPSGKLDRAALPGLEVGALAHGHIEPRTPDEELVARVWQDVLGVPRVGATDKFFALGGHSLLTTQVLSRLRKETGLDLPVSLLFKETSVERLAAAIARYRAAASEREQPRPVPDSDVTARRASIPQEGLWIMSQLMPDLVHHVPLALHLRGSLDVAALDRSLGEIIRRHESLRTSFRVVDGQLSPIIGSVPNVAIPLQDLSSLASAERDRAVREVAWDEVHKPFDLERGPLLRARLLRLDERDHLLLLPIHHLVADDASLGILVHELGAIYRAFTAGEPSPLGELGAQYPAYADWHRRWLETDPEAERDLAYWREQLAGLAALKLALDRPRPQRRGHKGAFFRFSLARELADAVRAYSLAEDVSTFVTLLAAWKLLLSVHTGQDDVAVGVPIADRNRPETENMIGFLVNTVIMRTDLSGDPSLGEAIARVRATAVAAQAHQLVPLEQVAKEAKLARGAAPLFQVLFTHQKEPATIETSGLSIELELLERTAVAPFDLVVVIAERAGLEGSIEYDTELFDETTIAQLADHYRHFLEAIVARTDTRISGVSLLDADQRTKLLGDARQSARVVQPLHELFHIQATKTPQAEAIAFETERLTYGELERKANQLAHLLAARGVVRGDTVALYLDRSLDTVVAILACLKAGAAYVPIDRSAPPDWLAFVVADSSARVLITTEAFEPSTELEVVRLDRDADAIRRQPDGPPAIAIDADELAYIIYTSGSTGRPKGVMVTHANVNRLFDSTHAWFRFDQRDVWTLFHSYAFDFSVWEIWGALLHGGRLVVVPFFITRSPEAFLDLLAHERVTVLNQTPSAFRQLVRIEATRETSLALREVIFGGEALDFAMLRPWFDRHPNQPRLVNMYGITETTVHVTYRPIRSRDLDRETGSMIGVPIPDLSLYILDRRFEPVPIGVPGEIYVGGEGLARGYLHRSDLTSERFVPDPFGPPGGRLYRTGDLARRRRTGEIEFLGRLDRQVKVRGFRIELDEIRAVLSQHPAIRDCVVVFRADQPDDHRLVAYLIPKTPTSHLQTELRNFLAARLPAYMVPGHFEIVDAFPMTTNGKLDESRLPVPQAVLDEASYVAPRNAIEEEVAQICREAIGVERLGIHDNFFDLGAHSLVLAELASQLSAAFQVSLPLRRVFDSPTVVSITVAIAEAQLAADPAMLQELLDHGE